MKILIIFALFYSIVSGQSQTTLDTLNSKLVISGTSTLHDWEINVTKFSSSFTFEKTNSLKVSSFNLEVLVQSMQSGKESMDENTWEELKYEDNPLITFTLKESDTSNKDTLNYLNNSVGILTAAGKPVEVNLNSKIQFVADSVRITGEKMLKMTDFDIDPPSMFLGTIKTGDEINIHYNLVFKIKN